jgi:hypothetical protein
VTLFSIEAKLIGNRLHCGIVVRGIVEHEVANLVWLNAVVLDSANNLCSILSPLWDSVCSGIPMTIACDLKVTVYEVRNDSIQRQIVSGGPEVKEKCTLLKALLKALLSKFFITTL